MLLVTLRVESPFESVLMVIKMFVPNQFRFNTVLFKSCCLKTELGALCTVVYTVRC